MMAKKRCKGRTCKKKPAAKKTAGVRLKVEKASGILVDYPVGAVRKGLSVAGFAGKTLAMTSLGVLKEAKKLAKTGVISATNLEKAMVKSVNNTNKLVMSSARKVTKKILK